MRRANRARQGGQAGPSAVYRPCGGSSCAGGCRKSETGGGPPLGSSTEISGTGCAGPPCAGRRYL